jgi:hypothetical protein
VDVEVTILAGGERRIALVPGVDPEAYRGAALVLKVDDDGRIVP